LKTSANGEQSARNTFSAAWGVIGVLALLVFALGRLTPVALDTFSVELNFLQWSLLVINTLFMAWSEGYRGFQKSFSPRVAARAFYIYQNAVPIHRRWLAPFYCCGYFGAGRRIGVVVWGATIAIVALVNIVNRLDQPWRGIIDMGVVVGLSWGVVSLLIFVVLTFSGRENEHSSGIA
jgi:hypothetical protein